MISAERPAKMGVSENLHEEEDAKLKGQMLVRRFTDSLDGETQLAEATVAAQAADDRVVQETNTRRTDAIWNNRGRNPSLTDFWVVDHAREELDAICAKFAQEVKPTRLFGFGIRRNRAQTTANAILQHCAAQDFSELQQHFNSLETHWRASHGPVYRSFQKILGTLDAHKKVFAIFPQANTYCAVFCGTLSLFIHAAVNHETIAETLSKAIAEISEKAAQCAMLARRAETPRMRQRLSDLYTHVFRFYRDAMEWFLKSKMKKFFGSFNEKVKERFDTAAKDIQTCVETIEREMRITMNDVVFDLKDNLDEFLRQQRWKYRAEEDLQVAGWNMQDMLRSIVHDEIVQQTARIQSQKSPHEIHYIADAPSTTNLLDRPTANDYASNLKKFVVGTDGQSFFKDGRFWTAESKATSRLLDWLVDNTKSDTLWISSPEVPRGIISSAQAAAMTAVITAWQSKTPIISHFCARPHSFDISSDLSVEQCGIIGLVYNLIIQLLQFGAKEDWFTITDKEMSQLDGSRACWSASIRTLSKLLKSTPQLSLCVIHGLNDLAWSSGDEWVQDLIEALQEHQQSSSTNFRILLTTTGKSKVLPHYVSINDRYFAEKPSREIVRASKRIRDWGNETSEKSEQ